MRPFELLVTKAILRSLEIDQILYVVLSGATSGEGLGFNRGVFFLADECQRCLRPASALGPVTEVEAHRIWEDMVEKDLTLEALLPGYDALKHEPAAHRLSRSLRELEVPIDEIDALAGRFGARAGEASLASAIARSLRDDALLGSRDVVLTYASGAGRLEFANWWIVPMRTPDEVVGALLVDDAFSDRQVSLDVQHSLTALADLTAIGVDKSRLFERMRAWSQVDGLTQIANRRTYDEAIERLLDTSRQTGRTLSLVVFDVDHFKRFNDQHGHLAGDDALRLVGEVLRTSARKSDVVARYGGEEFVALLPDTSLDSAVRVAEKMRAAVRARSADRLPETVTLCAGVANTPDGDTDAARLFQAADAALYRAKRSGRDRVEVGL